MLMLIMIIAMLFIVNMQCNGNVLNFLLLAGTVVYIVMQVLQFKGFSV